MIIIIIGQNLLYDNDIFKQSEEDKDDADTHPNVQGRHITYTRSVLPKKLSHVSFSWVSLQIHLTAPNMEASVRRVVIAMATLGREIDMILDGDKYQKYISEYKSLNVFTSKFSNVYDDIASKINLKFLQFSLFFTICWSNGRDGNSLKTFTFQESTPVGGKVRAKPQLQTVQMEGMSEKKKKNT